MSSARADQGIDAYLRRAMGFHQSGRLDEAEALYRDILRVHKRHADATHLLAMLMHQRGNTAAALPLVDRALKARPRFPAAQNSRGLMLLALGRAAEALVSFDRALAADPSHVLAAFNRGHALAALDRPDEAIASYGRAAGQQPAFAEAHQAMAGLLQRLGRRAEALACYDRALATRPEFPEALNDRAVLLEQLGRPEDALADYRAAIRLRPGFAEAFNNEGALLDRLGRHAEALESFRRAVALKPDLAGALMNLADNLYLEGRREEAVALVDRRLAADPADVAARLVHAVYQLPILYETEDEIQQRRDAYRNALLDLDARIKRDPRPGRHAGAVGTAQPFFLAYQGRPDRELQLLYGGIVGRIMADYAPAPALPGPPGPGERIRVGIVCGFFRQHPVWRIPVRGWVTQLDRSRFEVIGYHTGALRDAETAEAGSVCDRFIQGPLSQETWRAQIIEDRPHVLLYPEIGMDRTCAWLAAQRLAAVQCVSWGHPETSGFATIDAFLSSAAMEPGDADAHYSERLVRLAGIGVHYEPRPSTGLTLSRAELGLQEGVPAFWCGQSLYKYLPQFDFVFPAIARAVGACQFVFIQYHRGSHVTAAFRGRLTRAFEHAGLDADRFCVALPRLDGAQFAAAAGLCDLGLDSIGWSGCNSTLESLAHDLPVVTLPGGVMRARHTQAMLQVMGIGETVAGSLDEYVAVAVRLARDEAWRAEIRRRIRDSKASLYRTQPPMQELMTFLETEVRRRALERV